jgi:hypothetical protein
MAIRETDKDLEIHLGRTIITRHLVDGEAIFAKWTEVVVVVYEHPLRFCCQIYPNKHQNRLKHPMIVMQGPYALLASITCLCRAACFRRGAWRAAQQKFQVRFCIGRAKSNGKTARTNSERGEVLGRGTWRDRGCFGSRSVW